MKDEKTGTTAVSVQVFLVHTYDKTGAKLETAGPFDAQMMAEVVQVKLRRGNIVLAHRQSMTIEVPSRVSVTPASGVLRSQGAISKSSEIAPSS